MAKRRSNGEGTEPYQVADGRWRAELVVGWTAAGKPKKKIVYGKTSADCKRQLRAAIRASESGTIVLGKSPTVAAWMAHWLEHIVEPNREPSTTKGYRSKIRQYVDPSPMAGLRLDAVQPEHLDALYASMRARDLSQSTILQTHRIISRAFKSAVQRGRLGINPASRIDPPSAPKPDSPVESPITVSEARRLVAAAAAMPDGGGAGWLLNLAIGPRQAERLGLGWDCLDLSARTMRIKRTINEVNYKHGCPDSESCGRRAHLCPERTGGGRFFGSPKSGAGNRIIALPEQLVDALKAHQRAQAKLRASTGGWEPYTDPKGVSVDLVFCQDNGKPIGARTDWGRWQKFLKDNGVAPARVHDGRHLAATVLLLMGVDPRVVMEIMGWSQMSMLTRYQHVVDEIKRSAADAVGSALFHADDPPLPPGKPKVISVDFTKRRRA